MEQDIKYLNSIAAAEAAEEAKKNSWGTWFLSPIYKKVEDSEEENARKDRARQERRIEKDMKERRLGLKKVDLKKEDDLLKKAQKEVDAADLDDNEKIRVIQSRIRARETRERQERERVEAERIAKIRKQQQEQREKREREVAEALRKQWAEERAAEQKRQEEYARNAQKIIDDAHKKYREQHAHFNPYDDFFTAQGSTRQTSRLTCSHDGWWPKIQGRKACPECTDVWTYLLECPGCKMKACPKCQSTIRPRRPRNAARTNRRAPPRVRTPSPDYFYDY